jgi:outer membrane biosynthesis protein TonB
MVGFPLLLIPLAIYNIIVFLMPSVSFTDPLVKLTLMSGAEWTVTLSDVLLTLGILLLLAEVIKGARPGAKYLTDHLLSLIVFGAAAAEFVLWPKFGTSTYFLMTALSLVDFLSGLALRTRRRAVAAAPAPPARVAEPEKAEAPAAEPQPAPAPTPPPETPPAPAAPSVPAAASVAESVLQDPPEPKPVQPVVAPEPKPVQPIVAPEPKPMRPVATPEAAPVVPEVASPAAAPKTPSPDEASSPEIPSPRLQPGSGFPPSPDKPDTPQR